MVLSYPANISVAVTSNKAGIIPGTLKFSPHDVADRDLDDTYICTDDYFEKSAREYKPHLATMSMDLTATSISSLDEHYSNKSRNHRNLLTYSSFQDIEVNKDYTEHPTTTSMGIGVAHKTIQSAAKPYTLLAIVPRSAGYEQEWVSNFAFGESGVHAGFSVGRDIILAFTKEYVQKHGNTGDVKLWSAGYSRGAGVVNLLVGFLADNPDYFGFNLKPENSFIYSFGTPQLFLTR